MKYLRQQRGGSSAVGRALGMVLEGLARSVRKIWPRIKVVAPIHTKFVTPTLCEEIGKMVHAIKRPFKYVLNKAIPFRPNLPPGAQREWAKYVSKQFYAPKASEMVGKAVDGSIPVWQHVSKKPLIP